MAAALTAMVPLLLTVWASTTASAHGAPTPAARVSPPSRDVGAAEP